MLLTNISALNENQIKKIERKLKDENKNAVILFVTVLSSLILI